MMELLGVDGCRGGWVVARSDDARRPLTFAVELSFRAIVDSTGTSPALIVVDIPIGLPSGQPIDDGSRACDRAAREFLGWRRAVSVFSAPCRPTLAAESYAEACATEARARGSGKGLSRQAYGILPKIREVDLAITPALQERVREAHPEVTFAALSGGGSPGHGLAHAKRRCRECRRGGAICTGEADRLRLLHDYFPDLDPTTEHARLGSSRVGRDDIVDAVACLISAYRIATHEELVLPRGTMKTDARGLRMEIVA